MKVVSCSFESHAASILDIFNDAIINSTALFDYKPRSMESMAGWFKTKEANRYPVIGIEDDQGQLLGFSSYGVFRGWPAYKYTVEHSVYVHRDHRGIGLGFWLMERLIAKAKEQGYHCLVGGIESRNSKSILLHERLGFAHCGTVQQAGFKFGNWLDLAFYQLLLETPDRPTEE